MRPGRGRGYDASWPFAAICLLAMAATLLRTEGTDWALVGVAALIALAFAAFAVGARRVPRLTPAGTGLPFAVDAVLGLLRQSQGGSTSGYSPLAILPVIWVGLTRGPRSVAAICAGTTALFAVPIIVIGSPYYPETGWRSVVLWSVVAVAVGVGARRVVSEQRRLVVVSDDRAAALDRLVDGQTLISMADDGADAVMTAVAAAGLAVVGGDGAVVELLDGDEIVCTAVAGTATPWLGLRLPADASITGECFRTGALLICNDSEDDSRVAREACRAAGARSMILIPLTNAAQVKGVLIVWSATVGRFGDYDARLLSLLANSSGAALVRAELIAELTEHAVTDELTGLPNRRAWNFHLDEALARSRRNGEPLCVLLLDLDGFKEVNDRSGHAAGDALLAAVSNAWLAVQRTTDTLGRLGGDEFAVILERSDAEVAADVMRRLSEAMPVPHHASVGLAVWDGHETAGELLARADGHMYRRKAERRTASS